MSLWNEYSGSLPSLHNAKYAKFTASLLYTLYLPQAVPSLSPLHLPSLSLLIAPTLHSPALLCFPHSLPSFAILFSCMLFFKYLSSFSPFPLSSLSTCPPQPSSHPCIRLFSPPSPLFFSLSPCSVKAVPATLCSQYPLI